MTSPGVFADECCAKSLVNALRELGLDVVWGAEDGASLPDREQASKAFGESRVIISADYDFGDLAVRRIEPFIGLIVLAPSLEMEGQATQALARRIHDPAPLVGTHPDHRTE